MTVATRKGVLLRLPPALLERVDAAKGSLSRNEWLVNAIGCHLDDLDRAEAARDPGAQFGCLESSHPGLFTRTVVDETGEEMGMLAVAREDGVLEISQAPTPPGDGGPPAGSDPGNDAAALDESEGADNGSSSEGDWSIP